MTDPGRDPDDQRSLALCQRVGHRGPDCHFPQHEEKSGLGSRPEHIVDRINAYGHVRDNLLKHAEGYHTADHLLGLLKAGTETGRTGGEKPIIQDRRRIVITAPAPASPPALVFDKKTQGGSGPNEGLRFIDFEITIEPLTDIRILKTNHSLFSARVVPELSVKSEGTLVNAEGKSGEKGTWDVGSAWCDYFGTRDGITEGIAIGQHPGNRWFPSKWFTRDYGFFSPTLMYWLKGGKLTLRYRVVVHAGDTKTADIKGIFKQYERPVRRSKTQKNVSGAKEDKP